MEKEQLGREHHRLSPGFRHITDVTMEIHHLKGHKSADSDLGAPALAFQPTSSSLADSGGKMKSGRMKSRLTYTYAAYAAADSETFDLGDLDLNVPERAHLDRPILPADRHQVSYQPSLDLLD